MNEALDLTQSKKQFSKLHKNHSNELMNSWVDEFLNIYKDYSKSDKLPNVAIADIFTDDIPDEFFVFKKLFEQRGMKCFCCDLRDVKYRNNELTSSEGEKIDAVYRRCVTCDFEKHWDDVTEFIEAVRKDAVCLVGGFKTQIAHSKSIFRILNHPMTLSILTDEEQSFVKQHIPKTYKLERGFDKLSEITGNKDKWIIKPEDSYCAKGVYSGMDMTQKEWERVVDEYIVQEFVTPWRKKNIACTSSNGEAEFFNQMTGIYMYNKKVKGVYSRASKKAVITGLNGGIVLASVVLD